MAKVFNNVHEDKVSGKAMSWLSEASKTSKSVNSPISFGKNCKLFELKKKTLSFFSLLMP